MVGTTINMDMFLQVFDSAIIALWYSHSDFFSDMLNMAMAQTFSGIGLLLGAGGMVRTASV